MADAMSEKKWHPWPKDGSAPDLHPDAIYEVEWQTGYKAVYYAKPSIWKFSCPPARYRVIESRRESDMRDAPVRETRWCGYWIGHCGNWYESPGGGYPYYIRLDFVDGEPDPDSIKLLTREQAIKECE